MFWFSEQKIVEVTDEEAERILAEEKNGKVKENDGAGAKDEDEEESEEDKGVVSLKKKSGLRRHWQLCAFETL